VIQHPPQHLGAVPLPLLDLADHTQRPPRAVGPGDSPLSIRLTVC
jgi:hypothetical protein